MHPIKPLFILLLTALPTFARLGETKDECEKRYGKPFLVIDGKDQIVYRKADLEIHIHYWNDKASSISYERIVTLDELKDKKRRELTEAELTVLLDANKGNSEWKKHRTGDDTVIIWRRADGGASAIYSVKSFTFSITVAGYDDYWKNEKAKAEAEKAKQEAKKLDGF